MEAAMHRLQEDGALAEVSSFSKCCSTATCLIVSCIKCTQSLLLQLYHMACIGITAVRIVKIEGCCMSASIMSLKHGPHKMQFCSDCRLVQFQLAQQRQVPPQMAPRAIACHHSGSKRSSTSTNSLRSHHCSQCTL